MASASRDFLAPGELAAICEAARFPADIADALSEAAEAVRGDGELAEAAVRFRRELFEDANRPPDDVNRELLAYGADGALLAAVVYAGAIPLLAERYAARGLPQEVLVDTVHDLVIWMRAHLRRHGRRGLSELGWLHQHLRGELFRLGRLQFHFVASPFPVNAFRHRTTGDVAVLSEGGVRYRSDGQLDGTCGLFDAAGGWESAYAFDGAHYEGHPVSALGSADRKTVRLGADEWELALQKGDPVLNVHVPEGERLSPEACRDSYARAAAFAAAHFPGNPYRAFVCDSWLLAPAFRTLLPESSNIVRFQRDYHLLPVLSNESQALERVFGYGTTLADLPSAKAETSLQRIVRDHLAAGGRIHNAGGFRLA
ncbi:acyltransferase domain-containing protein [Paenibacillus sp. UNC496MF]|uniref:acyltransferase domain-containing protein n=1 Tax=Paenibacillus sp. UNC496MF TaxID=1502753 RepID=UPI000B8746B6|nr:acyltransferase domain-containing protein [Paenibacillus sp. UNC496MF]